MNNTSNLQPRRNPAWPFFYSPSGFRFVTDDFGRLVAPGNLRMGLKFAREGLGAHLLEEIEGPL